MEPDKLLEMVNEYFDRELNKNEESALFLSLSTNETARNYFNKQHLLKTVTEEMQQDFPYELERNILSKTISIEKRHFFGQKLKPFFVYAAVIILFFVSLFFYNQSNIYKTDLANITNKINEQNRTIESILNSLPSAEVSGVHQKESKEVVVKSTKL